MAIMPEDGLGEVAPQGKEDTCQPTQNLNPPQSLYIPCGPYLTCKICDRGTLVFRKIFRLSGPVIAIGYILLVPSIIGMVICAVLAVVVNSSHIPSKSDQQKQSTFDADFRQSCLSNAQEQNRILGYNSSTQLMEQYCECALSTYKETGSTSRASKECTQRAQDGSLDPLGEGVDAYYSGLTVPDRPADTGFYQFRGISTTLLIGSGIAFFVGGLLGWLLVMKKRVLQCSFCGAVVNAS